MVNRNNNMLKIIYFVLTGVVLVSCLNNRKIDVIDFTVESLSQSTIDKSVLSYSIIVLETNNDSKINKIKKVIIKNGQIYILNHFEQRQEIITFSLDGKYINKINEKDSNILNIPDFDIHPINGDISFINQEENKIERYSNNLDYIESYSINQKSESIIYGVDKECIYSVMNGYPLSNDSLIYRVNIFDNNFNNIRFIFQYKSKNKNTIYKKNNIFSKRGSNVIYFQQGENYVYEIKKNKLSKIAKIVYPKQVLPIEEMYDAVFDSDVDMSNYIYNINYFESEENILSCFSSTEGKYIGIYNKKSKKATIYDMLLDPACMCDIKIDIVGTFENYFILQAPRLKVKNTLNLFDKERTKCNNNEMFDVLDKMKPGDNPILLLIEF
jgi:hypothetical protein